MPTPAYINITGKTQGNITQGAFTSDSVGNVYAFILHFDSEGDRNRYIGEPVVDDPNFHDARHHAFKQIIGPLLAPQRVLVFDYAEGVDIRNSKPGRD